MDEKFWKRTINDFLSAFEDFTGRVGIAIEDFADRMATAEERKATALENIVSQMPANLSSRLEKKPRRRKILPEKKKILEMIQKLRLENTTYEEISDYLNQQKVPTFSGRGRWHAQTIHRLYSTYLK